MEKTSKISRPRVSVQFKPTIYLNQKKGKENKMIINMAKFNTKLDEAAKLENITGKWKTNQKDDGKSFVLLTVLAD